MNNLSGLTAVGDSISLTGYLVCSFPLCSNTGAEVESEPTDTHLLAQCLHAGGLPERDRRAAHPQISTSYLHTDRRGTTFS